MADGKLEVELINASGLENTDFFGKMDPYAILTYGTQEQKSSVSKLTIADTAGKIGARWNEKFEFKTSKGISELTIKFMDKNFITKDGFAGEATIVIWPHLIRQRQFHPTFTFDVIKYAKICGQVNVNFSFSFDEMTSEALEELDRVVELIKKNKDSVSNEGAS